MGTRWLFTRSPPAMEPAESIYNADIMQSIVDAALSKPQALLTAEERGVVALKMNFDAFSERIHSAHAEHQLKSSCYVCAHIPAGSRSPTVKVDLRRVITNMHRGS